MDDTTTTTTTTTTISSSASLTIHLSSSSSSSDLILMPKKKKKNKKKKTIYFAYGSNLWQHQMHQRCPSSKFLGIARLQGFRWMIYQRGFANIVEIGDVLQQQQQQQHQGEEEEEEEEGNEDYKKEVWGMIYSLEEDDEKRLDGNEGVPVAYQKEWIECEFWTAPSASASSSWEEEEEEEEEEGEKKKKKRKPADITKRPGKEKMLVYINREMTESGEVRKEYISRMNSGIRDAVQSGVPREYVEQVLRRWIPLVSDMP